MTMVSFGEPWGFVKNDRDERGIIQSFRAPLDYISFVSRWVLVRDYILTWSFVMKFVLPSPADQTGWGYLMGCAHRELAIREEQLQNGVFPEKVDFIQQYISIPFPTGYSANLTLSCIDARIDGKPLSEDQKRAHITLLIQAGSDTTSNSLSAIFRLLVTNLDKLDRAYEEIRAADKAGKLSSIVKYDEARTHLPFTTACIKESMRLAPPASFLFARVTPKEGSIIDGVFIPGGTEVTTHHYIVHLDPKLYAPDPNTFRPERWLESAEMCSKLEAATLTSV
jgi:hypothetical protein